MKILLIGGHGKVARLLTPLLVDASHQVSAVIRNPDHAVDITGDGAEPVVADVQSMSTDEIADAARGHELIIWAAGAGGGSPERTNAVDRDAAIRSIDAAHQAGVERYVMLSYFGAGLDHGVPKDNSFHTYAQAKAEADAHLRASTVSWTIAAPSGLTDDAPTGRIETTAVVSDLAGATVARGDVAAVIAAIVDRPGLAGQMVEFNSGSTPIGEALTAYES
ncbi:MAG: SDR family oxidoreductase [Ornithinimicrobium sp.]